MGDDGKTSGMFFGKEIHFLGNTLWDDLDKVIVKLFCN